MTTHYSMKDAMPNFGAHACELCHTSLAGERYDYLATTGDHIAELSICIDCVCENEGIEHE